MNIGLALVIWSSETQERPKSMCGASEKHEYPERPQDYPYLTAPEKSRIV
jgi:hypothetical protein